MNKIGIVGGSALYEIPGLEIGKNIRVKTPFGRPSDEFSIGKLAGREVVFLARHGRRHHILPSEVNYRANMYAFKALGVGRVFSISAVGSLTEKVRPLDVLLVDQFIDRTSRGQNMTFFGEGIVAHVPFADPVCKELRETIYEANRHLDVEIHNGGTYVNMEGPAFSTKAESFLYKSWGADVIGMTNLWEARLAREAGICYATVAMITDYDCWYEVLDVEAVSVEMIMGNLRKNTEIAKELIRNTVAALPEEPSCECRNALKHAILTPKDAVPRETLKKLKPIIEGFM
ncbi:MAG: S-methyl-5'-thioadenosine phosphorylase [Candidatus Omnitrophica bacterium]|nr:S-methyl-5'-thioadenosine phosphorylase [Candidatus Omnitrophota bacterium]MBU1128801.1 S-methyl-5'-thioadenosine phosphorylase [Candidatus Omnitrophota bacterium]MBU1785137.1 S-methyl-5'-thioadenosine phosphorylase [Candidatus Omnitrophota bacterium]MBU1851206.1 S-methyl-5'-thioadenosine phosphorylase [Candidatus Omnitrophota bacterium]